MIRLSKKTISKKENEKMYRSFNRTLEAYKALNPEKYTSLEMICYADLMEDKLIPYVRDLNETQGMSLTEDLILQNAHALWLAAYQNGVIDQFCMPTGKGV